MMSVVSEPCSADGVREYRVAHELVEEFLGIRLRACPAGHGAGPCP